MMLRDVVLVVGGLVVGIVLAVLVLNWAFKASFRPW